MALLLPPTPALHAPPLHSHSLPVPCCQRESHGCGRLRPHRELGSGHLPWGGPGSAGRRREQRVPPALGCASWAGEGDVRAPKDQKYLSEE